MSNYNKVVEIIERFYINPITVRQYEKAEIKYNIYGFICDFLEYINPRYRIEKYIRAKPEDFDCIQVVDMDSGNFVDLIHFPMTYMYVSLNIDKNFKENKHYIIEKCQSDMPGILDLCDLDIAYGLNKDYHKKLLMDLTMYTERYQAEFDRMYSDFSRSIPVYYIGKKYEIYSMYKKKKIFTSISELISYYGKDGVDPRIYIYSKYVKL